MAKIKSKEYEFNDEKITINFNCSTKGIFSTSLTYSMQQKLNIDSKLEGKSLDEIESIIDKAFHAYKDSNTSYCLKIGILFGAQGTFCKEPNGEYLKEFLQSRGPYELSGSFVRNHNMIGFDYRVLIEENRDGRITMYETIHKEKRSGEIYSWMKEAGDYYTQSEARRLDNEKIIDFYQTTLDNLEAITIQLQKATKFIVTLIDNKDMEMILSSKNLNLLVSGNF